ncbi:hypothetical protein CYG49_03220 [Candidatus Saccharibacteria bacterium]|nr:MAG: hypothetical protein CYG49_03220 [Candidatus Saccharibacteria bacterium]
MNYQDNLLALAAGDPDVRDALRALEPECVMGEQRARILDFLKSHPKTILHGELPDELQSDETYVKILLLQTETRYGQWSSHDRYFEAVELVKRLRKEHKQKQKEQLEQAMRDAQQNGDTARARELMSDINALIKEQRNNAR